jgi:hypothetical protein
LTGFLQAIEASGLAAALRTSFYAYPLVSAVHILGAGGLVVLVLLMHGSRRFAAIGDSPYFRRLAVVALSFMLVSGAALFSIKATEYAANPAFRIKMALLALALVNVVVYNAVSRPGGAGRRIATAVSIGIWPAVLVAGRFVGFV